MHDSVCDVFILGAGGHSKQVIDALKGGGGGYKVAGVFDDAKVIGSAYYRGHNVMDVIANVDLYMDQSVKLFCGIGDNETRRAIVERFDRSRFINVVAQGAVVSPSVAMGCGNYIGNFANVAADSVMGDFNVLNDGCCVTHDVVVGDFNHICPQSVLGGGVVVGNFNLIGTNANVNPRVKIGSHNKIGSGCAVVRDVGDWRTVVGVPGTCFPLKMPCDKMPHHMSN